MKVSLIPAEEIIIAEITEFSIEDFVYIMNGAPSLWVGGYLLMFNPVHFLEFDASLAKGIRKYRNVDFAVMPKYMEEFKTSSNMTAPILNYSNSVIGCVIAEFLDRLRSEKDAK